MSSFREWLDRELEQRQSRINDPCPMESEAAESGTVLGNLPDDLKPLTFLMLDLMREHNKASADLQNWVLAHPGFNPGHPDDAKPELTREFREKDLEHKIICDKLQTIRAFFWTSIKYIFPDSYNYSSITLCRNWQVVCGNEEGVMKIEVFGFGAFPGFEEPTTRGSSFLDFLLRRHS